MIRITTTLRSASLCLLFLLLGLSVVGQEQADPVDTSAKARDAAIARAMKHLDDRLWVLNEHGSPRKQFAVAVAAWAYLIGADKPSGSRKLTGRTRALKRMRSFLDRYTETVAREYTRDDERVKRGAAAPAGPMSMMRVAQYTWPLSMAAHFYAESIARGKKKGSSRKMLKAIVRVLESAQQPNGGWGHDDAQRPGMGLPPIRIPKPDGGNHEYPGTLLAASHCALSGLGVAHHTLKTRKAPALVKGRGYFEGAQNKNGTFPYDPLQRHGAGGRTAMAGGIEIARTSGAVFALLAAGANAKDASIAGALAAIDASPEMMSEGHGSATLALLFGAVLSRARGEEAWAVFRRIYFPRILSHQDQDGAFTCVCKQASRGVTCDTRDLPGMSMPDYVDQQRTYVTAIHILVLLLDRARLKAIPAMPAREAPVTAKPR